VSQAPAAPYTTTQFLHSISSLALITIDEPTSLLPSTMFNALAVEVPNTEPFMRDKSGTNLTPSPTLTLAFIRIYDDEDGSLKSGRKRLQQVHEMATGADRERP
jgi:hypothetical protein